MSGIYPTCSGLSGRKGHPPLGSTGGEFPPGAFSEPPRVTLHGARIRVKAGAGHEKPPGNHTKGASFSSWKLLGCGPDAHCGPRRDAARSMRMGQVTGVSVPRSVEALVLGGRGSVCKERLGSNERDYGDPRSQQRPHRGGMVLAPLSEPKLRLRSWAWPDIRLGLFLPNASAPSTSMHALWTLAAQSECILMGAHFSTRQPRQELNASN
jgi:hypothetical protein